MLTRLVHFQLGRSAPTVALPPDLDPRLVSDLRIAENVMGTIVGAVAGQEEATCRVIDSLMRLQEGEFRTAGLAAYRYGSFAEARQLARNVLSGTNVKESRAELHKYFREALRLQPQGEVLLRKCARDGARIADSRPIAAGTPVFASHGSAMRDVPEPDAFILDRPREHYLQYGWGRHTCLGQYVSPVIIVESMIAAAWAPGPRAAGAARWRIRRSRSSAASAGCSSTIRTSTRRPSRSSLLIRGPRESSGRSDQRGPPGEFPSPAARI